MIEIDIPGFAELRLAHLVLDFNGTLARDGVLLEGVARRLSRLSRSVQVHVLTSETRGQAREELGELPCTVHVVRSGVGTEHEAKAQLARELGAARCACIGNGRNDRLLLAEAALGVAVLQAEGLAREALEAADLVMPDIASALDLLLEPLRLVATLRS
jgi:soluble P-type ATPase